jgi:RecB family exonuclease
VIAWSYSRLQVYRECPKKFKYKFLDKLVEPGSPAMDRGNEIHTMLERYVDTAPKKKPPQIKGFEGLRGGLEKLRVSEPLTELELAFTKSWERTSWMAGNTWVRVKVDVTYNISKGARAALDYKSGKIKPEEHTEQLELYALSIMLTETGFKTLTTGIWYVDHETAPRYLANYQAPFGPHITRLKNYWNRQVAELQKDKRFAPKPSYRCRWCHFSKWNGGPCTDAERK